MSKKIIATQLAYDVTGEEKSIAEKAIMAFNRSKKSLVIANDYLNIIYNPFSKTQQIDSDQIYKYRAALRRFRDSVVDNFNNFKISSFKCVELMNTFSSDTQTIKLMKSFANTIDELETRVNYFIELFSDLKSKTFVNDILKNIEEIRKKCEEIKTLIEDRIKIHIKDNILSKNWVDSVGDKLQINIQKQTPIMVDLYKEKDK